MSHRFNVEKICIEVPALPKKDDGYDFDDDDNNNLHLI
jgi:hypothetical protein